MIQNLCP